MKQYLVGLSLAVALASPAFAQEETAACRTGIEACHVACKRFDLKDSKRAACDKFCGPRLKACGGAPKIFVKDIPKPVAPPAPIAEPPKADVATTPVQESAPEPATEAAAEPKSETPATTTPAEPSEISEAPVATQVASESETKSETPVEASAEVKPATVAQSESPTSTPSFPSIPVLTTKRAAVKEADQNLELIAAIASGNQKVIRRLIESNALNPTFVYSHDFNTQTRQYEGRIVGLRLVDILNDTSTLRTGANSLDRVFALFLELGMDVTAKINDRTAWGPSLRAMEGAKDRDARLRTFDMALEAGLMPNSDLTEWLFAELPQVCGRDRSKFAISVMDVLVKRLGPTLKDNFWRESARGPETLSDVLDLSFAQPGKTAYEKELAAEQDKVWENCAPLSRRINKFLVQGN